MSNIDHLSFQQSLELKKLKPFSYEKFYHDLKEKNIIKNTNTPEYSKIKN